MNLRRSGVIVCLFVSTLGFIDFSVKKKKKEEKSVRVGLTSQSSHVCPAPRSFLWFVLKHSQRVDVGLDSVDWTPRPRLAAPGLDHWEGMCERKTA